MRRILVDRIVSASVQGLDEVAAATAEQHAPHALVGQHDRRQILAVDSDATRSVLEHDIDAVGRGERNQRSGLSILIARAPGPTGSPRCRAQTEAISAEAWRDDPVAAVATTSSRSRIAPLRKADVANRPTAASNDRGVTLRLDAASKTLRYTVMHLKGGTNSHDYSIRLNCSCTAFRFNELVCIRTSYGIASTPHQSLTDRSTVMKRRPRTCATRPAASISGAEQPIYLRVASIG